MKALNMRALLIGRNWLCVEKEFWFPKPATRRRQLRYWPPFSLPDIGSRYSADVVRCDHRKHSCRRLPGNQEVNPASFGKHNGKKRQVNLRSTSSSNCWTRT
jgi:hypothetical protein